MDTTYTGRIQGRGEFSAWPGGAGANMSTCARAAQAADGSLGIGSERASAFAPPFLKRQADESANTPTSFSTWRLPRLAPKTKRRSEASDPVTSPT